MINKYFNLKKNRPKNILAKLVKLYEFLVSLFQKNVNGKQKTERKNIL